MFKQKLLVQNELKFVILMNSVKIPVLLISRSSWSIFKCNTHHMEKLLLYLYYGWITKLFVVWQSFLNCSIKILVIYSKINSYLQTYYFLCIHFWIQGVHLPRSQGSQFFYFDIQILREVAPWRVCRREKGEKLPKGYREWVWS